MKSRIKSLCKRAKKGDKTAAQELLTNFYANIYTYLRRLCGSNQDAEDYLITTADTIMASTTLAVTGGRPVSVSVGDQQIPAYSLTVAIAARRN